jgi:hypothetical protein
MTNSQQILEEGLKEFDGFLPDILQKFSGKELENELRFHAKSVFTTLYNRGVEAGMNEVWNRIEKEAKTDSTGMKMFYVR